MSYDPFVKQKKPPRKRNAQSHARTLNDSSYLPQNTQLKNTLNNSSALGKHKQSGKTGRTKTKEKDKNRLKKSIDIRTISLNQMVQERQEQGGVSPPSKIKHNVED